MNLDAKALTGFIKEIEDSRARQRAETEFQQDVFKRARKKFFDVKAMRIVLQRRAMDTADRDEQDYNVESYELALAGKKAALEALEAGKSIREAATIGGISTGAAGNLRKSVQKSTFVDSATGEITDSGLARPAATETAPSLKADEAGGSVAIHAEQPTPVIGAVGGRETVAPSSSAPVSDIDESCGSLESRQAGASSGGDLGPCESMTCEAPDWAGDNSRSEGNSQPSAGVAPGPHDTPLPKGDPGEAHGIDAPPDSTPSADVIGIAAEILALPKEERIAAIMVVDALTKAPAVAAMISDEEAAARMEQSHKRLQDMMREKGFASPRPSTSRVLPEGEAAAS